MSYQYQKIKTKYPDRTPLWIVKSPFKLNKVKFLVPKNMHLSEFAYYFRTNVLKKQSFDENKTLLYYIENNMYPLHNTFSEIEQFYNDTLKMTISVENTFG